NANTSNLVAEAKDDDINQIDNDEDDTDKLDKEDKDSEQVVEDKDSEQVVEDEDSEQVVEDEDSEQVVEDEDSEQVVEDENLDLEETEESSNEEISDQDLLQATNNFKVETYNANSSISLAKQENKVEEPVVEKYAEKFVNVEFLNVREAASTDANIVTTIQAGDKVTGTIEGDWLNTDQGYIKLSY